MGANRDIRHCVGALVHAKATSVTNAAQCARLFVSAAKTKFVNGTDSTVC